MEFSASPSDFGATMFYLRAMRKLILCVILLGTLGGSAQVRNVKDSTLKSVHMAFSYGFQIPTGDMASRFGNNHSIGFLCNVKSDKNWFYGLDGVFLFGNNVVEPGLLGNLYTDAGEIIDNQGKLAILQIQERGYVFTVTGGKLFDIIGPNPNSGILLKAGVGFMQHKIRLEHQINKISQLEGEMLKGYDRLTNGLVLSQFVGYYHMGNKKLANFYFGVDIYEGFTQGRRDFNFDTGTVDDEPRLDGLIGLRAGWVLHLYSRSVQEYYFN